jgi:integrase
MALYDPIRSANIRRGNLVVTPGRKLSMTKSLALTKSTIDKMRYGERHGTADSDDDSTLQAAKQDIRWDANIPGFGVRIYPSGKKAFVLAYRVKGRKHIKVVGRYGVVTLEEARQQARKELNMLVDNKDPLAEKRKTRHGTGFTEFCKIYMERHGKNLRTAIAMQRRIDKYLIPEFGTRNIESLSREDALYLYRKVQEKLKRPYEANRVIQQLSKMIERAIFWGIIPDATFNITKGVKTFKERKRDRFVTIAEMPKLAKAIEVEESVYGRYALWLYLLVGLRRDELLCAKWSDVDFRTKHLRIEETKASRLGGDQQAHYATLSDAAIKLLNEIPREKGNPYILPGKNPNSHLVNINKIWIRVRRRAGLESDDNSQNVRIHDLRRTVGSWLAQSGESLPLIGKVLHHASPSTTAIYAHFKQDHVKIAMDAHAENLLLTLA